MIGVLRFDTDPLSIYKHDVTSFKRDGDNVSLSTTQKPLYASKRARRRDFTRPCPSALQIICPTKLPSGRHHLSTNHIQPQRCHRLLIVGSEARNPEPLAALVDDLMLVHLTKIPLQNLLPAQSFISLHRLVAMAPRSRMATMVRFLRLCAI